MILISICIPTYNRVNEIKHLNDSFLKKVLNEYGEVVEVVICDNSDDAIAEANRNNIDSRIKYTKNGKNLGFPGNVLRCTEMANGEYIWLLSDNDHVLWPGFVCLMQVLYNRELDCILVPYTTKNYLGETSEERYSFLDKNKKNTLFDVLTGNNDFLPFNLLSGGVVRLDKSHIQEIRNSLSENVYVQIALLLSMLRDSATIQVLSIPLIDYETEHRYRFSPVELFDSIIALLEYLSVTHESIRVNKSKRANKAYRSLIFMLLSHYSGLCNIHEGDRARRAFFVRLLKHIDIKNLLMFMILMLPRFISGQMYIIFLAKDYANKGNSVGIIGWFKRLGNGVTKLRERRLLSSE